MTLGMRTALILSWLLTSSLAFTSNTSRRCLIGTTNNNSRGTRCCLRMGLYDQPLPERPERPNNENEDTDELPVPTTKRIFRFNVDGKERRGLLPSLGRTLDSGIGCYFEESDRVVQNLVEKTECHPTDAAWALEACKGDVVEAWTRISVARRQLLDERNKLIGGTLSSQVSELMAENEFEIQKEDRSEKKKQEDRKDYFKPSKPDQDWLPLKNPKPIDDEPWFTG